MPSVLITGSKGFIGSHLSKFLQEKGCHVVETGGASDINLCDWSQVETLPGTNVIVHLAARSFIPFAFEKPAEFYRNNFLSTLNVLELARKNSARVIFFSTYVYGNPTYLPVDEAHPVAALNPYTQSKLMGEELCQSYSRDFGVPVVIFRPFNVYGPGQHESFLIPKIIGRLQNETIELADPRPRRDFIYIDDILEAVYCSIAAGFTGSQIFNLGSGTSISVSELVQTILDVTQSAVKITYTNSVRKGEILETKANVSKAKKTLGWMPTTELQEGLSKTVGRPLTP